MFIDFFNRANNPDTDWEKFVGLLNENVANPTNNDYLFNKFIHPHFYSGKLFTVNENDTPIFKSEVEMCIHYYEPITGRNKRTSYTRKFQKN